MQSAWHDVGFVGRRGARTAELTFDYRRSPKMGPYPDATAVFDIDAIGLTNMVNKLNHGLDLGNNPTGKPTAFSIGVASIRAR